VILFENREDAVAQILQQMPIKRMKKEDWVILAVSEGGVFFA